MQAMDMVHRLHLSFWLFVPLCDTIQPMLNSFFNLFAVLFTSPKQHLPEGLRTSHAHKPSRIRLEIRSGTVVFPVCKISWRR